MITAAALIAFGVGVLNYILIRGVRDAAFKRGVQYGRDIEAAHRVVLLDTLGITVIRHEPDQSIATVRRMHRTIADNRDGTIDIRPAPPRR